MSRRVTGWRLALVGVCGCKLVGCGYICGTSSAGPTLLAPSPARRSKRPSALHFHSPAPGLLLHQDNLAVRRAYSRLQVNWLRLPTTDGGGGLADIAHV